MVHRALIFDTETTGLPVRGAKPQDVQKWDGCRLVQIAWEYYDEDILVSQACYTVKPDGFVIPASSAKIHGITQDIAVERGVHIDLILEEFMEVLNRATVLVAHNIEFDWHVMTAEYYRQLKYVPDKFHQVATFCTMKAWTPPGGKWPKLNALYLQLFGITATDCHQADNDVRYCAAVYFKGRPLDPGRP